MATLLDGKLVANSLKADMKDEIAKIVAQGHRAPGLAVIQVGEDPASSIYVRNKEKACAALGIVSTKHHLAEDTTEAELLALVEKLNNDPGVDGILCQLPLPKHLNSDLIIEHIAPEKDVDGFHPINAGKLLLGLDATLPCTPAGVIEILKYYKIPLSGKNAVVLGRSNIVGKPQALLLLRENCTVTVAHSKTRNLAELCAKADILVSAMGRLKMVDSSYTNPDQVIVDVSINRADDGKVYGDVDFEPVSKICSAITPVPGGVGPMTITMLMKNTLQAYKNHEGLN